MEGRKGKKERKPSTGKGTKVFTFTPLRQREGRWERERIIHDLQPAPTARHVNPYVDQTNWQMMKIEKCLPLSVSCILIY